jgi:hypothetical protein
VRDPCALKRNDFNVDRGFMVRSEAVAFVAISMGCQDLSSHKAHFQPKSTFQNGSLKERLLDVD